MLVLCLKSYLRRNSLARFALVRALLDVPRGGSRYVFSGSLSRYAFFGPFKGSLRRRVVFTTPRIYTRKSIKVKLETKYSQKEVTHSVARAAVDASKVRCPQSPLLRKRESHLQSLGRSQSGRASAWRARVFPKAGDAGAAGDVADASRIHPPRNGARRWQRENLRAPGCSAQVLCW